MQFYPSRQHWHTTALLIFGTGGYGALCLVALPFLMGIDRHAFDVNNLPPMVEPPTNPSLFFGGILLFLFLPFMLVVLNALSLMDILIPASLYPMRNRASQLANYSALLMALIAAVCFASSRINTQTFAEQRLLVTLAQNCIFAFSSCITFNLLLGNLTALQARSFPRLLAAWGVVCGVVGYLVLYVLFDLTAPPVLRTNLHSLLNSLYVLPAAVYLLIAANISEQNDVALAT